MRNRIFKLFQSYPHKILLDCKGESHTVEKPERQYLPGHERKQHQGLLTQGPEKGLEPHVASWPKTHNLKPVVRRHQTKPNWWTYNSITGPFPQKNGQVTEVGVAVQQLHTKGAQRHETFKNCVSCWGFSSAASEENNLWDLNEVCDYKIEWSLWIIK